MTIATTLTQTDTTADPATLVREWIEALDQEFLERAAAVRLAFLACRCRKLVPRVIGLFPAEFMRDAVWAPRDI